MEACGSGKGTMCVVCEMRMGPIKIKRWRADIGGLISVKDAQIGPVVWCAASNFHKILYVV